MQATFEAADGIHTIDTRMSGRDRVTSAYLIRARRPALVETGPATSVDSVLRGLEELGVGREDLAHIVVTHIHLDHAGGAGALAARFPRATVWVHERGAPHLADPTGLVASAERVYGEAALRQFQGTVDPVPADRLRSVADGSRIDLGDRSLEVLYTPGHAGHHVCLVDSSTGGVFVGDALGMFLPDVKILRPATLPPEFDLELAVASVDRVAARDPQVLLFSHFGPSPDVAHLCGLATARLRTWTRVVEDALQRTDDLDEVEELLRQGTASEVRPAAGERRRALEDRYELVASYRMNAMGLTRYLAGRREGS